VAAWHEEPRRVYAVGSGSKWDHQRNSSEVRGGSVNAAEALRALAAFRRSSPEHAAWIESGYPTLTEAEHLAMFDKPYDGFARRRPSSTP